MAKNGNNRHSHLFHKSRCTISTAKGKIEKNDGRNALTNPTPIWRNATPMKYNDASPKVSSGINHASTYNRQANNDNLDAKPIERGARLKTA